MKTYRFPVMPVLLISIPLVLIVVLASVSNTTNVTPTPTIPVEDHTLEFNSTTVSWFEDSEVLANVTVTNGDNWAYFVGHQNTGANHGMAEVFETSAILRPGQKFYRENMQFYRVRPIQSRSFGSNTAAMEISRLEEGSDFAATMVHFEVDAYVKTEDSTALNHFSYIFAEAGSDVMFHSFQRVWISETAPSDFNFETATWWLVYGAGKIQDFWGTEIANSVKVQFSDEDAGAVVETYNGVAPYELFKLVGGPFLATFNAITSMTMLPTSELYSLNTDGFVRGYYGLYNPNNSFFSNYRIWSEGTDESAAELGLTVEAVIRRWQAEGLY